MTEWPADVAASAGGISGTQISAPAAAAVRESLQWRLPVLFSDKWESFVIVDKACGECASLLLPAMCITLWLGWKPRRALRRSALH